MLREALSKNQTLDGERGSYRAEERIGIGGTSQVYRVSDQEGRVFAAKLLSAHRIPVSDRMRHRFVREMALLERISHPNVVAFHDRGQCVDEPFLVMELAERSLYSLIREYNRFPRELAVSVLLGALAGAGAIHEAGMVHRDLAPRNILLMRDGRVAVGDFGTVRNLTDGTLTAEGDPLGSLIYLSRKQFENPHTAEPTDDVFQPGQVGYELLTGRRPVGNAPPLDRFTLMYEIVEQMRGSSRSARYANAGEARRRLMGAIDSGMLARASHGVELADRMTPVIAARQLAALESIDPAGSPETVQVLQKLISAIGPAALGFSTDACDHSIRA